MYLHMFIATSIYPLIMGGKKAFFLPEGSSFAVDAQHFKKQFLCPCLSSKALNMFKKLYAYSSILCPWAKHHET